MFNPRLFKDCDKCGRNDINVQWIEHEVLYCSITKINQPSKHFHVSCRFCQHNWIEEFTILEEKQPTKAGNGHRK